MGKIKDNLIFYLICLYIIILPFGSETLKIKSIPVKGDMVLALIILIYLLKIAVSREVRKRFYEGIKDFFTNKITISMLILFTIMMFSVTYAVEKDTALKESLRFFSYMILFFIIKYELFCEKYIKGIIKSFILLIVSLGIIGIFQYVSGWWFGEEIIRSQIAATMGNRNTYGAFLILFSFPFIILFINEKDKYKKTIYGFLSALILINIILTNSRNAWLGFFIGCLLLTIIYCRKAIWILGGVGAAALFIPQINQRVKEITDFAQNESRIKLWQCALKIIEDHPIKGVGNGNFVRFYDYYKYVYHEFIINTHTRYPVHNSYLKVFSELGLLGISAFIAVIVCIFIKIKHIINTVENKMYKLFYSGFMISFIAFLFMNISDDLFFVPKATSYFWILVALGDSLIYDGKYRESRKK